MSHYTIGIITKEKPSYAQIEDMLEPYSENMRVAPYIVRSYEEVKKELVKYTGRVLLYALDALCILYISAPGNCRL